MATSRTAPNPPAEWPQRPASLLWRIYFASTALFFGAWALLALTPASVKPPYVLGGLIGLIGLLLLLLANLVLIRRALVPLGRLTAMARDFDPLRPGPRIPVYGSDAEIVELTRAFNDMLDRLERERRDSARRALEAQEEERARIARELHDEIGQSLTAVLLRIEHVHRNAPPEVAAGLEPARETARASLEEVKRIAQRLRPEALDDLGLRSALMHLTERIGSGGNVRVKRVLAPQLPQLDRDRELVIYRVAQEALTNVLRHSGATEVEVRLGSVGDAVVLTVRDDGVGMNGAEGGGIKGMRERAILIGADLEVTSAPGGGVEVRLEVNGNRR